jgi:hypothetical protein
MWSGACGLAGGGGPDVMPHSYRKLDLLPEVMPKSERPLEPLKRPEA